MQIFWHGNTCVRIEAEHGDQKATLVTDPYGSETGLRFPRTLAPDVVALSHEDPKRFPDDAFTNTPFLINHPGEYEANGLFVFGTRCPVPAQLDIDHEETVWNRYTTPDGREITVSGFQTYDPAHQLQHWTTIRRWRDASGEPAEWSTRITLRYQTADEIVALLRANGLAVRDAFGTWDGDPLTLASEDMRFVCTLA